MTVWMFNQSGTIPGIPGIFAGVRVFVDEVTNTVLSVTPLAAHAEFEPALNAPTADTTAPVEAAQTTEAGKPAKRDKKAAPTDAGAQGLDNTASEAQP